MEYGVAPFDRLGAAVGASASVKPNDVNTLAQRIEEQEAELAKREAQLAGREDSLDADVGAGGTTQPVAPSDRLSLIYTTLIGALLLALILYNFYLDARFRLRPSG